jgi:hypothetical protein
MIILFIISAIFAVYYLTTVLTESDGAWGALARLRGNKAVDAFGLLNCFMCTAFWVSVPFGAVLVVEFGAAWWLGLISVLSIAGIATLINKLSMR